jgi:hypothetical protein
VIGFPWWPGRISTPLEENLLSSPPQNKTKYVAITFLGTSISRGWVGEASILPFDSDSMATKLQMKKLLTDRNYLDAVCEAIRIELSSQSTHTPTISSSPLSSSSSSLSDGKEFPEEVMTAIENILVQ